MCNKEQKGRYIGDEDDDSEEGDLASIGVRCQKWTALLQDNCDWFGITGAEKKVKALPIYGGERARNLVESLPESASEEDAFFKTMAKLDAQRASSEDRITRETVEEAFPWFLWTLPLRRILFDGGRWLLTIPCGRNSRQHFRHSCDSKIWQDFLCVWNTGIMKVRQWSTLPKQRVCRVCKNARS